MSDIITKKQPAFERYEGDDGYAMLAFSYDDSEVVFPFIEELHNAGARLWYDKGAAIGSNEAKNIEKHIEDCTRFFVFYSPAFAANDRMCNALRYAIKLKKPVTYIQCKRVDDTEWTSDLLLYVSSGIKVLIESEGTLAGAKAELADCGAKVSPEIKADTADSNSTSVTKTDEQTDSSEEGQASSGEKGGAHYIELGGVKIGIDERRVEIRECGLTSIDGIQRMTRLSVLILSGNNISDISPLSEMTHLTTVNLSGNHITDLSALGSLKNLAWLIISNNQIADITPLLGLTSLRNLYINGNPVSNDDVERLRDALPKCSVVF